MMSETKTLWCAYCGRLTQGNYSCHRDALGEGPEVDLCDGCGKDETPTLGRIWSRISLLHCRTHQGLRQVCSTGTVGCIVEHPR